MDIDVIVADGPASGPASGIDLADGLALGVRPIPRSAVGAPERRCLICSQPARVCMRARNHSVAELLAAVDRLLIG